MVRYFKSNCQHIWNILNAIHQKPAFTIINRIIKGQRKANVYYKICSAYSQKVSESYHKFLISLNFLKDIIYLSKCMVLA